jgi:hypothetical protein
LTREELVYENELEGVENDKKQKTAFFSLDHRSHMFVSVLRPLG